MKNKTTDLVSLFEKSLEGIAVGEFQETGIVIQVGDNICRIHGLDNAMYGELIQFEGGNKGVIFQLDQDTVDVFILDNMIAVSECEIAKRTGDVFKIPVSTELIGRVVDATGMPIDSLGDIACDQWCSIEADIPSIIQRSPINEPLETGIVAIDALVPIGKGQRELIIGNRSTGKTAIALDTIINQKGKNVYAIYVAIGKRQANVARVIRILQEHDALKHTVIVSAGSSKAVLNHYMAPYVGCTIGEYLRDQGHDVVIIYDDLSSHAVAFREMSLLLRRAPGREAYPGDVFYLHSRLLERAGKLASGGSLTALPIVQTQSDDITAYIPTNLISITDGQVFLDTKLFNRGIRPAVNVELSVSRVGGAAQSAAMKKVAKSLRLELAQYHELAGFSQFGTELDTLSQKRLLRGAVAIQMLKQKQRVTYSFIDQVLILFLLKEAYLDAVALDKVQLFVEQFVSYVSAVYPSVYKAIETTQNLSEKTYVSLRSVADEFRVMFSS